MKNYLLCILVFAGLNLESFGEHLAFKFSSSTHFPGTERLVSLSIPDGLDTAKPVFLFVDLGGWEFDSLKTFSEQ